ncbi:hypothetical protein L6164_016900 [Bauhinia variegata]|uniref:Uncharacterized protein n=1 Tax=Bauhinia variegata TaxID=167791 RepID=A0ACB9N6R2_BAUVA|nr:hypothetical protein L6164_016900 [Bauhinia variegata]
MSSPHTIPNDVDPKCPLVVVMLSNILKLTSTNYLSWKLQIEATLVGYGLFKYLDGTFLAPPTTITTETVSEPNPAYLTWVRQDKLLFGALIGTYSCSTHLSISHHSRGVVDVVHARDTPISFNELHEKLLNCELMAKSQPILPTLPASVHATTTRPHYNTQPTPTNHFHPIKPSTPTPNVLLKLDLVATNANANGATQLGIHSIYVPSSRRNTQPFAHHPALPPIHRNPKLM